ncbi:hypothetical protein [Thiofaba sp. EF100]|jgi:hypothetical protein|uniref:PA3496 family putative envelope integrity protein n=1 Tax=Thiofaba sp. EF100 TaxID=3121274 RepID=UPI0032217978
MTNRKSIEDIAEDLWSVPETVDINEEALKAKAALNKDARRRLDDLMEERRLKKAIEDDYLD